LEPSSISASHGWARCGHCQHVFDAARAAMPTLAPRSGATQTLSAWGGHDAPPAMDTSAQPEPLTHLSDNEHIEATWDHLNLDLPAWVDPSPAEPQHHTVDSSPTDPTPGEGQTPEQREPVAVEPSLSEWQQAATSHQDPTLEPTLATDPVSNDAHGEAPPNTDPLYVNTAQNLDVHHARDTNRADAIKGEVNQIRWKRPLAWASLLILTGTLLGQLMVAQRHQLVARWPATQAWLQPLCERLGCEMTPLRDLSRVQITHSSVVKLDEQRFQLDLEVRNDGALTIELPMVELSLENAQSHVWTRRVLSMHTELPLTLLNAHSRLAAQLFWHMDSPDAQRVEGYRLRLVYPQDTP